MKKEDFKIGEIFKCGEHTWKCTDIGTRTIEAICISDNHSKDRSWYYGPPYAISETVFDEYDFEGCSKEE